MKTQTACCPSCGQRIPFRKFVQLNNFSVTNCTGCKARIEISNRTANAIIAGVSGTAAAASVVIGIYVGQKNFGSWIGGFVSGLLVASTIIAAICMYAYTHSQLNRIHNE